jgi:hypothetical protein
MSDTIPNPDNQTSQAQEASAHIAELRGDRRVFLGFMAGGLALLGAGVVGAYSLISGDHVPVVGSIIPGAGALTSGAVLTIPGAIGAYKTNQEIHNLTQQ